MNNLPSFLARFLRNPSKEPCRLAICPTCFKSHVSQDRVWIMQAWFHVNGGNIIYLPFITEGRVSAHKKVGKNINLNKTRISICPFSLCRKETYFGRKQSLQIQHHSMKLLFCAELVTCHVSFIDKYVYRNGL